MDPDRKRQVNAHDDYRDEDAGGNDHELSLLSGRALSHCLEYRAHARLFRQTLLGAAGVAPEERAPPHPRQEAGKPV